MTGAIMAGCSSLHNADGSRELWSPLCVSMTYLTVPLPFFTLP